MLGPCVPLKPSPLLPLSPPAVSLRLFPLCFLGSGHAPELLGGRVVHHQANLGLTCCWRLVSTWPHCCFEILSSPHNGSLPSSPFWLLLYTSPQVDFISSYQITPFVFSTGWGRGHKQRQSLLPRRKQTCMKTSVHSETRAGAGGLRSHMASVRKP